ncbi:MAG: cyclase family protein [Candidatus Brocadiaceae bacterium]|jgi:arylformamidase
MSRFYDVSVPLRDGMPIYPGDEPFRSRLLRSIQAGEGADLSAFSMSAHTGTHVDAPAHMLEGGATLDAISPETLIGPARVVEVPDVEIIGAAQLESKDWAGVQRVLLKTSNSGKLSRLDRFVEDFVALDASGAGFLADLGLRLVGVDYLSVDRFHSGSHPAHTALMRAGTVIVEGLDLSAVPPGDYELICAPLRIAGADGAPARVFLRQS